MLLQDIRNDDFSLLSHRLLYDLTYEVCRRINQYRQSRTLLGYWTPKRHARSLRPETYDKLLNFTDKQSYLEWVKNWKHTWNEMVAQQKHIRFKMDNPNPTEWMDYKGIVHKSTDYGLWMHRHDQYSKLASALLVLRFAAREKALDLKNSKLVEAL